MTDRLNIKLLLPTAVVGVFFMLITLVGFGETLSKGMALTVLFLMVLIQLVCGYLFSQRKLTERLESLQSYLDMVVSTEQAPDKSMNDDSGDDFAKITNDLSGFINNLSDVMAEIRGESEELRQVSELLRGQMDESVNAVDESANQIEQMANSIEQIASTSQTLSISASQVSETSSQVMSILTQGRTSSHTNQKTIAQCAKEVNGTADELALLQEECSRIGSVLDVIRGIADQTNLLALNAAIEAARAGEQGRGFAVVADEVRALAHRTQEATVEIQSMVEGLQSKSTNAVSAISRGQALSQESLTHSEAVVEALEKIGEVFSEVDTLTSQIASGTNEQQESTASINDNMAAVVTLSREINQGLSLVSKHAHQQKETASAVDITLNRICV